MSSSVVHLKEMGLTRWVFTTSDKSQIPEPITKGTGDGLGLQELSDSKWVELQNRVSDCQLCSLHGSRHNTVCGTGNPKAHWMLVGEAPGAEEDRQGQPFVGRAGQLLSAMLFSLNLSRHTVFIGNVLKCRPPDNRDPLGDEVRQCAPFLHEQIRSIQPRIILAMGRFAAQALLQADQSIAQLRGRVHCYPINDTPLVVTYHPAYLLRSPQAKAKTWEDLQRARAHYVGQVCGDQ